MELFPKLLAFDIDGTLVASGHEMTPSLASSLGVLVAHIPIAFVSGRSLREIERVLETVPFDERAQGRLFALPTCGAAMHEYRGVWHEHYAHALSVEEQRTIHEALHQHVFGTHFITPGGVYDAHVLNRGTSITFVAFGHELPLEEKRSWDPTREKRARIKEVLENVLPGYASSIGGYGSIDITREGMDKAFGIRSLARHLNLEEHEITFVGDMLFSGGNDYPVTKTGARTIAVESPLDTERFVDGLLREISS